MVSTKRKNSFHKQKLFFCKNTVSALRKTFSSNQSIDFQFPYGLLVDRKTVLTGEWHFCEKEKTRRKTRRKNSLWCK